MAQAAEVENCVAPLSVLADGGAFLYHLAEARVDFQSEKLQYGMVREVPRTLVTSVERIKANNDNIRFDNALDSYYSKQSSEESMTGTLRFLL